MLSKSLFAASFLFLASAANAATFTQPHTTCSSIPGGPPNSKHTRSYTRVSSCTNTLPKSRTTSTTTNVTPTSTSTVYTTSTFTTDTHTDTATDTVTVTTTVNSTTVETVTSTQSTSTITTVTSYYPTTAASAPTKRAVLPLEPRASPVQDTKTRTPPPPGIVCVINRCTRTRLTTTSTITSVFPETTVTQTLQQNTTVTPNASTTVNTTVVDTSTSTITSTDTATTVSTSTITTTYTASPTFYIQANGLNPQVADGTDLTNQPDSTNGEGTGIYSGSGTSFVLDPATGYVYQNHPTYGQEILNTIAGNVYSPTYFDTQILISDYGSAPGGAIPAVCTINNSTLELECNTSGNNPNNVFATLGQALYLNQNGGGRGYYADHPTVDITNQQ